MRICVEYPFVVVKEESAGLQSPEVKPSFEFVKRRDPGSGSQEPVSTENSLTGHLWHRRVRGGKKGFNSVSSSKFSCLLRECVHVLIVFARFPV